MNKLTAILLYTDLIKGSKTKQCKSICNINKHTTVIQEQIASLKKIQKSNIATTLAYSVNANLTGDGSTAGFTLGTSGRTANDILVTVNGVVFNPSDDYTLSGTTLTFTTPPSDSAEIRVRYLPA